ncbi:unnamed protein product, partial [Trichogramma brassicae]
LAEIQCFSETYEILQRYQFRKSRLHLYVQDDKKQANFFFSSGKIKSLTCTTIVKTSRARTYNRIYSAIKARVLSCNTIARYPGETHRLVCAACKLSTMIATPRTRVCFLDHRSLARGTGPGVRTHDVTLFMCVATIIHARMDAACSIETKRNWNQPLQIIVTASAESGIIITYNTSEEEAIYQARRYISSATAAMSGKIYTRRAAAAASSHIAWAGSFPNKFTNLTVNEKLSLPPKATKLSRTHTHHIIKISRVCEISAREVRVTVHGTRDRRTSRRSVGSRT